MDLWNTAGYSPRRALLEAIYSTGSGDAGALAADSLEGGSSRYRGTLSRLRLDRMPVQVLERLESAAVDVTAGCRCSDQELLELLARFPVPLSDRSLSVLKSLIGSAEDLGGLLRTLSSTGDVPDNSSVSRAVARASESGDPALLTILARWASRGRGVRPGLLLPLLRSPSREVSTCAARAVLILSRRWVSPEFDRTCESVHI
jgi:hypothetical protein